MFVLNTTFPRERQVQQRENPDVRAQHNVSERKAGSAKGKSRCLCSAQCFREKGRLSKGKIQMFVLSTMIVCSQHIASDKERLIKGKIQMFMLSTTFPRERQAQQRKKSSSLCSMQCFREKGRLSKGKYRCSYSTPRY